MQQSVGWIAALWSVGLDTRFTQECVCVRKAANGSGSSIGFQKAQRYYNGVTQEEIDNSNTLGIDGTVCVNGLF